MKDIKENRAGKHYKSDTELGRLFAVIWNPIDAEYMFLNLDNYTVAARFNTEDQFNHICSFLRLKEVA